MKYRKKPVVIDAWEWKKNGDAPEALIHMLDSDSEWICTECGHKGSKHQHRYRPIQPTTRSPGGNSKGTRAGGSNADSWQIQEGVI
jgi:hypothetical protein